MLAKKILLAFDGSNLSNKALKKAAEIAKTDPSIQIDVVHVVSFPILTGEYVMADHSFESWITEHGNEVIMHAKTVLSVLPNTFRAFVVEGASPARIILEHAKKEQCDLIVMGSRGLSGIKEIFLGSVSHNVMQHATVPILIVK